MKELSNCSLKDNSRLLIIIDDFEKLFLNDPSLPSILQNSWDNNLKYKNIMLIFCGNDIRHIEENVLSYKNPLYGRGTGIYKVSELTFKEVAHYFSNYASKDKVILYSLLTENLSLLSLVDKDLPLEENIKTILKTKSSIDNETKHNIKDNLYSYSLPTFINICEAFIRVMGLKKLLPFRCKTLSQETINNLGIIIKGISEDGTKLLFGKCKFNEDTFTYSEYEELKKIIKEKDAYYALFSLSGFDNELITKAKEDSHLMLFDIDSVVEK